MVDAKDFFTFSNPLFSDGFVAVVLYIVYRLLAKKLPRISEGIKEASLMFLVFMCYDASRFFALDEEYPLFFIHYFHYSLHYQLLSDLSGVKCTLFSAWFYHARKISSTLSLPFVRHVCVFFVILVRGYWGNISSIWGF